MVTVDGSALTVREINEALRRHLAAGDREITVLHPGARHNLAVAMLTDARIIVDGPVGYYCGGMSDGVRLEIRGSAGWGVAECLMGGEVVVDGHAGNSAAASIRGGVVVVRGSAGARAGIAMKGGLLVIGGDCGYMTGFMMQRGRVVVCGNAGPALADSMYEGAVFVGGEIAELGNDTVLSEASAEEHAEICETLARYGMKGPDRFRKVVSGRKLWNYDKKDMDAWKAAF